LQVNCLVVPRTLATTGVYANAATRLTGSADKTTTTSPFATRPTRNGLHHAVLGALLIEFGRTALYKAPLDRTSGTCPIIAKTAAEVAPIAHRGAAWRTIPCALGIAGVCAVFDAGDTATRDTVVLTRIADMLARRMIGTIGPARSKAGERLASCAVTIDPLPVTTASATPDVGRGGPRSAGWDRLGICGLDVTSYKKDRAE